MELTVSSHDSDSTLRVAANTIVALIEARKADDEHFLLDNANFVTARAPADIAPGNVMQANVPDNPPVIPPMTPPAVILPPPPPVEAVNTAAAVGVELDINGVAWNPELHSAKRSKNKDGTWRNRRGVGSDDETAAVPPPPPPPAADAAPAAKVYPTTVATLMPLITAATTSGKVTMVQIAEACQMLGVPNGLGGFAALPEMIPLLCDALGLV